MEEELKVLPLFQSAIDSITVEELEEFSRIYDEWVNSLPKITDHLKPYSEDKIKDWIRKAI